MKKITAFWIITTIIFGCNKDNYPQCLEGKVVWGNCAGSYVKILSKGSPIKNKVGFGNKGSAYYKEFENVFFTDTISVRGDSIKQTFLFQLQPFVRRKQSLDIPCQHIIDTHIIEGTIDSHSVIECN